MSPLDSARIDRSTITKHGVVDLLHYPSRGTWQAVCRGIAYDEDDVPRACGWAGPERDVRAIAFDDACWHHHEEGDWCGVCMACLSRIGNLWEAL